MRERRLMIGGAGLSALSMLSSAIFTAAAHSRSIPESPEPIKGAPADPPSVEPPLPLPNRPLNDLDHEALAAAEARRRRRNNKRVSGVML